MKIRDYIIVILILIAWIAEDLYLLFPSDYKIQPFLFSDRMITQQRYIFDIIIYVKFSIFVSCILIKKENSHWIIFDLIWLTVGLIAFSGLWYVIMYNNPYYKIELWLKFITVGLIFFSIKSIQWHGRRNNNSIFSRGIRRDV